MDLNATYSMHHTFLVATKHEPKHGVTRGVHTIDETHNFTHGAMHLRVNNI